MVYAGALRSCTQCLRRIDAVGAPKELREPARVAEAVTGGNADERLWMALAQYLGPGLLEPDAAQGGHWRRAPEAFKRHLQSAGAASRSLRNVGDRQRRAGIGAHELLGPANMRGCGGAFLLMQPLRMAVRQTQQQAERQIVLEGPCRNLVGEQRIGTFQLDKQKIEHPADRRAGAAHLVEGGSERERFDLSSIQQNL